MLRFRKHFVMSIALTLLLLPAASFVGFKAEAKPPAEPKGESVKGRSPIRIRPLDVEVGFNGYAVASQGQSWGGGFGLVPRITTIWVPWLELGLRFEVQFAKELGAGVYPMVQGGGELSIAPIRHFAIAGEAGLGGAYQSEHSSTYAYYGANVAYLFQARGIDEAPWQPNLLRFLDRVFLRYDYLTTRNRAHFAMLGIGFRFL